MELSVPHWVVERGRRAYVDLVRTYTEKLRQLREQAYPGERQGSAPIAVMMPARYRVEAMKLMDHFLHQRAAWVKARQLVPPVVHVSPGTAAVLMTMATNYVAVTGRDPKHFGMALGCDWYENAEVPYGQFWFADMRPRTD